MTGPTPTATAFLEEALDRFRDAVEEIATRYDDRWGCESCLRSMLAGIALHQGVDRLYEIVQRGEATP